MKNILPFNARAAFSRLTLPLVGGPGILQKIVLGLALATVLAGSVKAQTILASGQLSATAGGGGTWNYSLTVSDDSDSTSPIGSLWYAWIPGQFYLPSAPSSASAPTGWSANIVPGTGGYSIQFIASSAAYDIGAGYSLTFNFVSLDSPTVLAGNSPSFPGTPIGTTVAYGAGLFSSPSETFVVQSVPEPAVPALFLAGLAGCGLAAWRRARQLPARG